MIASKSKIPIGYVGYIPDIATREVAHRIWDGENWHIAYDKDGFYTPEARKIIDELSGKKPVTKPFDPTKPVQTRDGRKARILCTDLKEIWPIVAAVTANDGGESVKYYRDNGLVARDVMAQSTATSIYKSLLDPDDLINIPERTSRWANLYKADQVHTFVYRTRIEADAHGDTTRTGSVEIIFEDGKPVDVKLHRDEK